jgi:hypothetical protein
VSYAPGPFHHEDAAANPDFGLYVVQLADDPDTGRPTIVSRELVSDEAGLSDVDCVVVTPRVHEHLRETYLDPEMPEGTGTAVLYDATTIASILLDLTPTGREGLVEVLDSLAHSIRVVVNQPISPADVGVDPARVANGDPRSTHISNGIHTRRWYIGPAPLADDKSLYVRLPAGAPVTLQVLNEDGMNVLEIERHFFLQPGEPLGFGVSRPTFNPFCGGCHGSFSGKKEDAVGVIDALTSASEVIATRDADKNPIDPIDATNPALFNKVDFVADVEPVLVGSCATAACHGMAAAGGLNLAADPSYDGYWSSTYEALMRLGNGSGRDGDDPAIQREYVDERRAQAIQSFLVEMIYARDLAAPRAWTRTACEADTVLDDAQKRLISEWIDLGATYKGGSW